ncbi:hypothetical protein [Pedobacter agri]|uniref:hypothetical protein n=1 Tax=Pedobacter agri TaxID=454586 RepID=UPI002931A0F5|nr:hypothetical protein [Pedobacter agri]
MPYILRNITHFSFFSNIDGLLQENQALLSQANANTFFKTEADKQIDKCRNFLISNLSPNTEEILGLLHTGYLTYDYNWSQWGMDTEPAVRKEIERFDLFHKSMIQVKGYLMMMESLQNASAIPEFSGIGEKSDFLLRKLHQVFGEETYSLQTIMRLNDIPFRSDEANEIAKDLGRRGYVNPYHQYSKKDEVQLSVKGANYIERKDKSRNKIKLKPELDAKFESIIEQLTKLGHGQEIIFDEITELKELQHKLSKKNWSQLLKGKLIDLAIDGVINKDTAIFIFEYLTNNQLKLL